MFMKIVRVTITIQWRTVISFTTIFLTHRHTERNSPTQKPSFFFPHTLNHHSKFKILPSIHSKYSPLPFNSSTLRLFYSSTLQLFNSSTLLLFYSSTLLLLYTSTPQLSIVHWGWYYFSPLCLVHSWLVLVESFFSFYICNLGFVLQIDITTIKTEY